MKYVAYFKTLNVKKQITFSDLDDLRFKIEKDSYFSLNDFFFFEKLFMILQSTPAYETSMTLTFTTYKIVLK